jgi:hypothetical protein
MPAPQYAADQYMCHQFTDGQGVGDTSAVPDTSPSLLALLNKWETDVRAGLADSTPDNASMIRAGNDAAGIAGWCKANGFT